MIKIIDSVQDRKFASKSCDTDLVTQTDKKVQEFLFGRIKLKYPTHELNITIINNGID